MKDLQEENKIIERPELEEEIAAIMHSNLTDSQIKEKLEDYHEYDIAEALELLSPQERQRLYKILDNESVSDVMSYADDAAPYLEEMNSELAADIIEGMDADDAVDALEDMGDEKRNEVIKLLDADAKEDIALIKSFDEDEVGSIMTTNFIAIRRGDTIKQAMKELIEQAADNDNISTLFVENKDGTFYGALDLKDLIMAREHDNLEDKVTTSFPFVYSNEKIEECFQELRDYSEDSIPVLDTQKHVIGVITTKDIVEVLGDEMGEDYVKLAGLTDQEDLNEPLIESMKKRIPWLIILLVLGLVVSSVVGIFEGVVSQLALVVCFQSLILDMAGNVGTQSLAVTIRVLTDEQLDKKELLGLVWKEIRVGFSNGLLLGILAFIAIGIYIWLIKSKTFMFAYAVSGCIGIALMLSMVISSFTGTVIPIFFKGINVDPAVASGPLITTVNDLVAVVTYYGLVWVLLINMLQLVE